MSARKLLVVGAGGHGKAIAEAALLNDEWQQIVFADDRWPQLKQSFGWPVVAHLDGLAALRGHVDGVIVAIGNNAMRERCVNLVLSAGLALVTVVHPRAHVSAAATVGAGTAVMALAMVGTEAKIGVAAIINAGATVDHDACIGDFAHLGVGVQLAGGVQIGARSWLQAGCSAGYRVVVAEETILGPGTVLTAD